MTPAQMVAELQSLGLSQQAIANKVECSQPTIYRISKGASPSYPLGCRIEQLLRSTRKSEAKAA